MTVTEAESAVATADAALSAIHARVATASATVQTFATARSKADAYARSKAFLGNRPDDGVLPKEPAAPGPDRPTSSAVVAARTTIKKADEFVGAKAVAENNVTNAKAALTEAIELHRVAVAEKARVEALVKALRQAPGIIAREQIALLGDLSPLALDFPAPTEANPNPPAVVITINGLPLDVASDGEIVYASLLLRLAVQRLSGMVEVPVFVDRANLHNGGEGPWPDEPGIVYLVTTANVGEPMSVRAGRPGGA